MRLKSKGHWPPRKRKPVKALLHRCERECAGLVKQGEQIGLGLWSHRDEVIAGAGAALLTTAELIALLAPALEAAAAQQRNSIAAVNAAARWQGAVNNQRAIQQRAMRQR